MLLDEARQTDQTVSSADVALAEREAAEAEELLAELERRAIEGSENPARVLEQRGLSEFARRRVEHTRQRAAAARAAKRLLELAEVGADVDALANAASQPDRAVAKAARAIAKAAGQLRQLCAEHDAQVAELMARAAELRAEESAPAGPRGTSAHVTVVPNRGVQHGRLRVTLVGDDTIRLAVTMAAGGDPEGALQLLAAVHELPEQRRQDHYFRSGRGHVIGHDGPLNDGLRQQLRDGTISELTPSQVSDYLNGVLG